MTMVMMSVVMSTVGTTTTKPQSIIWPIGMPRAAAIITAPIPGTISAMPVSRLTAKTVLMMPTPALPRRGAMRRARGAAMTIMTSTKIVCRYVAKETAIAYGTPFGPNTRSNVSTSRETAPRRLSIEPMSTPHAMRRPASAMVSPKPVAMVSTVPDAPSPPPRPMAAAPIARAMTGLTWKRTMSSTTPTIATPTTAKMDHSGMRRPLR